VATTTWSATILRSGHSTIPRHGKHIDPESDRQAESFCVLLEIGRHLILRGARTLLAWERPARQAVVARGGEQAKRVPPAPPAFAQTRPPLQDNEVDAALGQVVACGKSSLAATDHHDAESLDIGS
jgi:hypothetical protein